MQATTTRNGGSEHGVEEAIAQPVGIRSRVAVFENLQAHTDDGAAAVSPKLPSSTIRKPAPTYAQGRKTSGPSSSSAASTAWAKVSSTSRDSPYNAASTWRGSSSSSDLPSTSTSVCNSAEFEGLPGASLKKSGSGLSLNSLAASRDGHENGSEMTGYRRGSGDLSPVSSRTSSPRLGVRNIIALYGGQGQSQAEASSSSPRSRATSVTQQSVTATDSSFLRPNRLPRHMLDTSDDGSASLSLHPSLSPTMAPPSPSLQPLSSPSGTGANHPLRRTMGMSASASAEDLVAKRPNKPPAPPRPAKPSSELLNPTAQSSESSDPSRPHLYDLNLHPPTPTRRALVRGAAAPSLRRSASGSPSRHSQLSAHPPPPVLPPRKMTGTSSTTSPPTAYASRSRHGQSNSTGSVPALPPRGTGERGDNGWDAMVLATSSNGGPPAPPPRPRNGVSPSNSVTSIGSDASSASATPNGGVLPPPPRHRLPAQAMHRSNLSGSGSDHTRSPTTATARGFTLGLDAKQDLRNSLQNEIGDRAQLVGRVSAVDSTTRGVSRPAPPQRSGTITPARRSLSPTPMASTRSSNERGREGVAGGRGSSRLSRSPDRSARGRYEKLFGAQVAAQAERAARKMSANTNGHLKPSPWQHGAKATAIPIVRGAAGPPLVAPTSHSAPNSQTLGHKNDAAFVPTSMGCTSSSEHEQGERLSRKRIQRIWAASRLPESFLQEVWDAAMAFETCIGGRSDQRASLGSEAFVRGLTAIDAELAVRTERRRRSGMTALGLPTQTPRGLTAKRGGTGAPSSNWASALRLPAVAASAVKAFTDAGSGAAQSRSSSAGHVERRLPPPAPA